MQIICTILTRYDSQHSLTLVNNIVHPLQWKQVYNQCFAFNYLKKYSYILVGQRFLFTKYIHIYICIQTLQNIAYLTDTTTFQNHLFCQQIMYSITKLRNVLIQQDVPQTVFLEVLLFLKRRLGKTTLRFTRWAGGVSVALFFKQNNKIYRTNIWYFQNGRYMNTTPLMRFTSSDSNYYSTSRNYWWKRKPLQDIWSDWCFLEISVYSILFEFILTIVHCKYKK